MPKQPDIVGLACDFSCVEINVDGVPVRGVASIDYDHGLEPGEVRVNGNSRVQERTAGTYSANGSMEMPYKYAARLIGVLGGPGATGYDYMLREFTVTVNFRPKGDPTMYTDVIRRCRIKKDSVSNKQGNEATLAKLELSVIELYRNPPAPGLPQGL